MLREQPSESESGRQVATSAGALPGLAPAETTFPIIAGYQLQRRIGRGGSATVYLAREEKHDRLVALKVLHPVLAASLQAERFLREIAIVAKLAHPNILPLLDSGRIGDSLYYVSPFVPGESLRARMTRERIPVKDAVRITLEAAYALTYAHAQGVIHRDIKPENILLADGAHAIVADFGIAWAMSQSVDDRITTLGTMPGTPRYMSPEQAGGDSSIGPASDVYSLGCVLYELLAGAPPFMGASASETLSKHLTAPVPALPSRRGISSALERTLRRSLAKRVADRFPGAAEFAAALENPANLPLRDILQGWGGRRAVPVAGALAGAAALLVVGARVRGVPEVLPFQKRLAVAIGAATLRVDTAAYFVAPAIGAAGDSAEARALSAAVRATLASWRDIVVVDEQAVERMLNGRVAVRDIAVRRAAFELEAGRYVRLRLQGTGSSRVLAATLYDTRTNQLLASSTVAVDASSETSVFRALTDSLLFRDRGPETFLIERSGTVVAAAHRQLLSAHRLLASGDFAAADTAFARALELDEEYPQALVWLAHVRSWSPTSPPWRHLLTRAARKRHQLGDRDAVMLDALEAMSTGDYGHACGLWADLTARRPDEFALWYGFGTCLRNDKAVVRDDRVRGGWRYRSSRHQAVKAFERAFRLRPQLLRGFGGASLSRLREIMYTSGAFVDGGVAVPPDTLTFNGYQVWSGDSLVFLPLHGEMARSGPGSDAMGEAIQRQRLRFRDVASLWKTELQGSVEAIEAFAYAMEMLGDEASLDTLRRARALAVRDADRARVAASEVLMRVKFSLPGNLAGLRTARSIADSLLREFPPERGIERQVLSAIAALLGRATLAASYARQEIGDPKFPALERTGPALVAFAALGGPQDSLTALESVVVNAVLNLPAGQQQVAMRNWVTRSATLAYPESRLRSLSGDRDTGLKAGNVVARAIANDTAGVATLVNEIAAERQWVRPADVTMDGLYPLAAALTAVGLKQQALDMLNRTLYALRSTASRDIASPARTGALMRNVALRARLGFDLGEPRESARWAQAIGALWNNSDPFLKPVVDSITSRAQQDRK